MYADFEIAYRYWLSSKDLKNLEKLKIFEKLILYLSGFIFRLSDSPALKLAVTHIIVNVNEA